MPRDEIDLSNVYDYYCSQRPRGQASETIIEIWERGGAFNDSITPSTYVPEYRSHIVLKVLALREKASNVLSLGCGNGFVEGELVANGWSVRAFDCVEEAVELTRSKGVVAFVADFFTLDPRHVEGIDVVYGDGILGHLFDSVQEMKPSLAKLASLGLQPGAWLIFSNDSPREPAAPFAPHGSVPGFWFIPGITLRPLFPPSGLSRWKVTNSLTGVR